MAATEEAGTATRRAGPAVAAPGAPERKGIGAWVAAHREDVDGWLFVLPFLLIYVVMQIFPVVQAMLMSLFDWDLLDPTVRRFVAFDNYAEMFGGEGLVWDATHLLPWRIVGVIALVGIGVAAARDGLPRRTAIALALAVAVVFGGLLGIQPGADGAWSDPLFWGSFGNTLLFVLYSTPVIVGVALLLAIALNGSGRVAAVLRVLFFAPYVLSVAVLTLIWGFLLNPDLGLIASGLSLFGLEPISWLTDPALALPAIVVVTMWWTMGFNLVLFIAGLQDIEPSQYEAASIDGANGWQKFRFITVPGLQRTIVLVSILQVIASFQIFGQVFILTRGGPANSTRVVIQHIYESGFREFRLGYAAALSIFLFLVMLGVSFLQLRLLREEEA